MLANVPFLSLPPRFNTMKATTTAISTITTMTNNPMTSHEDFLQRLELLLTEEDIGEVSESFPGDANLSVRYSFVLLLGISPSPALICIDR